MSSIGVRLSFPAPMELELAPLLFAMLKPELGKRFPLLHVVWQDTGIVVWKGGTPVLLIKVHDDYVMVSRQVPRYEMEPKKILAACPDFVDKILNVLIA